MSDKLELMLEQQLEFMNLLKETRGFPNFPVDLTSKDGQKLLKTISFEAMGELFEAVQHLKNSKAHRATEVSELNREEYLEELTDCLHYFFEIVLASGISSDELFDAYMKKGQINFERIKKGY